SNLSSAAGLRRAHASGDTARPSTSTRNPPNKAISSVVTWAPYAALPVDGDRPIEGRVESRHRRFGVASPGVPMDREAALDLDAADPLAVMRSRFVIADPGLIYL